MRRWLIEKLGGHPDIDSAIQTIKAKDLVEKTKILDAAVKLLFNTIDDTDILRQDNSGQWSFEGKLLTRGQVEMLIKEAEQIFTSFTWKILQSDVKYQANRRMFIDSKSDLDLIAGKLCLYNLKIINTRFKSMIAGSGHFNTKIE